MTASFLSRSQFCLRSRSIVVQFVAGSFMALTIALPCQTAKVSAQQDIELQVGVVQRFGGHAEDTLMLRSLGQDRLSIQVNANGKPQTIATNMAALAIVMEPLPEAHLEERVVFSTHRSFESAEEDANRWKAAGIPVEIAQPKNWQVWAKRDVYNTPFLRRLLLQSVQAKGFQTVFLDTQLLKKTPQAVLTIGSKNYAANNLKITANQGNIQVTSQLKGDDRTTRLYPGRLQLQANAYGSYTLVNQVPLEAYLRGVVPHEIGTSTTQSVLEVQAILARTYALRNLRRFEVDNYQLCADTQCQVYFGVGDAHPKTDLAIATTRGKVLTYENELVDAVYSANAGGVTAAFNHVWHGVDRPYLTSKIDAVANVWDLARKPLSDEKNLRQFLKQQQGFNEANQKWFRWRYESTIAELNLDLQTYLKKLRSPFANFKSIQQLSVVERAPSGRVQKLQIVTDRGKIHLEKDNILNAFYAPVSLLFHLDPIYDAQKRITGYTFTGGGLGHGVGLSQTGSYRLGELGWSSDRILNFYYPGTQLQPISTAIVFWRDPQQLQSARSTQ